MTKSWTNIGKAAEGNAGMKEEALHVQQIIYI